MCVSGTLDCRKGECRQVQRNDLTIDMWASLTPERLKQIFVAGNFCCSLPRGKFVDGFSSWMKFYWSRWALKRWKILKLYELLEIDFENWNDLDLWREMTFVFLLNFKQNWLTSFEKLSTFNLSSFFDKQNQIWNFSKKTKTNLK